MSVFYCQHCQNHIDSDIKGCVVDPVDDSQLVCEDCYREILRMSTPEDE